MGSPPRLPLILLFLVCGAAGALRAEAQSAGLSATLRAYGMSYVRTASPLTSSRTLAFNVRVSPHQSVSFGTGYERFTSFPRDEALAAFGKPTWKLRSVPLSVDYVFTLRAPERRVMPVLSFGMACYLSRISLLYAPGDQDRRPGRDAEVFSGMLSAMPTKESRLGMGYGVHAALGLRVDLSRDVFVLAQSRLRYVDGLGLSYDPRAEFTRLDLIVGAGFKIR